MSGEDTAADMLEALEPLGGLPASPRPAGRAVGTGPKFRSCDDRSFLEAVRTLEAGDQVDVLLDDGAIYRATVRHPYVPAKGAGEGSLWLHGLTGSYAAGRVRPPGAWAGVQGVRYTVTAPGPGGAATRRAVPSSPSTTIPWEDRDGG